MTEKKKKKYVNLFLCVIFSFGLEVTFGSTELFLFLPLITGVVFVSSSTSQKYGG